MFAIFVILYFLLLHNTSMSNIRLSYTTQQHITQHHHSTSSLRYDITSHNLTISYLHYSSPHTHATQPLHTLSDYHTLAHPPTLTHPHTLRFSHPWQPLTMYVRYKTESSKHPLSLWLLEIRFYYGKKSVDCSPQQLLRNYLRINSLGRRRELLYR